MSQIFSIDIYGEMGAKSFEFDSQIYQIDINSGTDDKWNIMVSHIIERDRNLETIKSEINSISPINKVNVYLKLNDSNILLTKIEKVLDRVMIQAEYNISTANINGVSESISIYQTNVMEGVDWYGLFHDIYKR